jgi:hypothetical protein
MPYVYSLFFSFVYCLNRQYELFLTPEQIDAILPPGGKVITKRTNSSSSLFGKFRRSSSGAGGVSDNSSHSIQSKGSVQSMQSKGSVQSKSTATPLVSKNNVNKKNSNSVNDHEYAYLYDLIDTTSDGKLSTTEFIRALKHNPSVAEVRMFSSSVLEK